MITVDTGDAERFLEGLYADQLPFAAARALSQTAKDVKAAEQQELASNFIIRAPDFILNSVHIPKLPSKHDSPMEVSIELRPRAGFLAKFQAPGVKVAHDPSNPIAVPSSNIRPSRGDLAPRGMYPRNLRLVPRKGVTGILPARRHVTKRGVVQLRGKMRTFVLSPAEHLGVKTWGVYQRTGPGPHDVRLIWTFKSQIPIPKRFDFFPVAERVVRENWPANWARAFAEAIASAR